MIRKLSICLLFFLPFLSVGQESIRFRHISKKEGLSNNTVFAITEDKEGFIWLGTRNGLNRYDGYRLQKFYHDQSNPNSIVSNDIRALKFEDQTNSLWIGTPSGLSQLCLDNNSITNYLTGEEFWINDIAVVNQDVLLVATNKGLFKRQNNGFVKVPITDEVVRTVYVDRASNIWVSAGNNLYFSNAAELNFKEASTVYEDLSPLSGAMISCMFEDSSSDFWFGTESSGLYKWEKRSGSLEIHTNDQSRPDFISSDRIRAIREDTQGQILIGTSVGLNIYHSKTNRFSHVLNDDSNPQGLSNNSIRSIEVDREGGIWLGTYYRGINYSSNSFNRFNISYPYSRTQADDRNIISAVSSDNDGKIWIGTEGTGIANWDYQTGNFQFIPLDDPFHEANVKAIYPQDKYIWMGTFQDGLFKLNKQGEILDRYNTTSSPALLNNNIYDIQENDTCLMLASYGGGLILFNPKKEEVHSFAHDASDKSSIASDNVRLIYKDHDGETWLGTVSGISRLVGSGKDLSFETFLNDTHVYSISSVRRGEIWIGTFYNGLYRLDTQTGKLKNYSVAEGLPGNTVYSILSQGENLWLSTDQGIVQFSTATEEFISFGNDVELKGVDYSLNSSHNYQDKMFLFGTNSGLVYFRPENIQPDSYQPPLVLSGLRILGEPDSVNQRISMQLMREAEIQLNYENSNIEILFSSLDYSNPANNRYAFRMIGVDPDWIYSAGNPQAIYTLQKEGEYTFQYRGSNSDGVWSEKVAELRIKVSPPWFRSMWAYALYLLLAAGVTYIIIRLVKLRHSYKIEHIAKVEQDRSHQLKTRFFTNITHELRTPLTLMLGPLQDIIGKDDIKGPIKNKLEGVYKNVVRLSQLVNQLLDFRKLDTDHMKMKVAEGDLVEFIQEIYFAFREETTKRNIDFIFETEHEHMMCWYDADKMEKVFFNLLSNALKFTPDFGLIKIQILDDKDNIKVVVQDNGEGIDESMREQIFERFYERNSLNYSNYGVGIGLALSKQLVELHQGSIYVENAPEAGSSFVVELKKGWEHFSQDQIVVEEPESSGPWDTFSAVEEPEKHADEKKLRILIVEDDLEIREYIKSLFQADFSILLASNGQEGFEVAKGKLPDVIISDVMMPKEDGITMCRKVKTTLETSHIPVILLTARAATPYKIGGLETGADDYITKPFNSEELVLKTKNIIAARTAYLEKLSRTHDFEPDKIAITSTDEKFLTRLMELAEKNIENSGLSVEQLADELHVSRALLFTKIKSLTGKTPKGFIKDIRLKRAAQLLEDTDLNISQVAHKSGFKDYRYFTKVFKGQYKMSPKEYSKEND